MSIKYEKNKITYFDDAKEVIKEIEKASKPLTDCPNTVKALEEEYQKRKNNNPYLELAEDIIRYKENGVEEEKDNYYFYLYLQELTKKQEEITYDFPLKDNDKVSVTVKPLEPFVEINGREYVNPKWHLLVSYYMYIDAAFNHVENIREFPDWKNVKRKGDNPFEFNNIVFNTWKEEQGIQV